MKKIISLLTALCLLLSAGVLALAEDASLTAITEKGEFVLGLDDAFPPMGFRDEDDNIVGFDIDVAAAVCEKLNVKLVCQPVDWETKELELSSGAIDCIWNGFTVTDERREVMDFSNAYLSNQQVLCVRADDDAAAVEDAYGRTLGYQSGSSAEGLLNADDGKLAANFGDTFGYDTYLMALMDLENGNVDAVLGDLTLLSYQIAQEANAGKFKVLTGSVADEEFAIGMRKGDTALVEAVNTALNELAQEGVLAEISTKWFGSDITLIGK
jgi:polar amino acid transport system substrate-binding protein